MRRTTFVCIAVVATVGIGVAAAQSIKTDSNVESDGQLVSNVITGTAPLAVSSTTMVPNLNADQVDGMEGSDFALDGDLTTVETMLVALQAQVDALGLALVPRTGQATCYDVAGAVTTCGTGIGLGQDGDLQLGVTWPNPRFTKNADGTVTDNLTALVWLEDANCANGATNWSSALSFANTLFDGSTGHNGGDCGLSDGSVAGQWRLPHLHELHTLVHYELVFPAVPDTAGTGQWSEGDPFSDVVSDYYWTSTTVAASNDTAWEVLISSGNISGSIKTDVTNYVWLVRDAP